MDALRIDRSERPPSRARRVAVGVVLLGLALAAVAAGRHWLGGSSAAAVVTAQVREQSGAGPAGTVLNASGYVAARRRATLSSKITARVVEVLIEEGTAIRRGDTVARLDDTEFRAGLRLSESRREAAARATDETVALLDQATLTLRRTGQLVGAGVSGQAALDQSQTDVTALEARLALQREQVRVAEGEVALRRIELANTLIRAPFDGVVISKDAQPGEMVSPVSAGGGFTRTGVCTVVDMSSLEIEVDVNESYISRVRPRQRVEATLDAYPDWKIPAHVITAVPTADRQKATVLVRIGFDELDPRILPDMGVKVAFLEESPVPTERPRTRYYVPRSALRKDAGQDVVLVVVDGRVERRAVRAGAGSGSEVEIESGLTPGEQVVVQGPADLADGDPVRRRP